MKKTVLLSLLTSALLAGVTETAEGISVDIYADKDAQSNIVATVSTSKGHLIKKRCLTNRRSKRWCKVEYKYDDIDIKGYVDEASLNIIYSKPHTRPTFEISYGGRHDDIANDIVATKDGFIAVGKTGSFGKGQDDIYVVKIDKFGNKKYSLTLGGHANDEATSLVKIEDGYILAGVTSSYGNGDQSIYLARVRDNGALVWHRAYYSDKDDYYKANDIIRISKNNTLVVGYEEHIKFFASETNIYVNAVDLDGNRNGIKRYGGDKVDEANSVINLPDGYLIAGFTKTWGHGGKDAYVLKIDKAGKRVWHNAYGFRYDEEIRQIIATSDGGYLGVGFTDSDIKQQKDIYVVKINADGSRAWHYHYGSREDEEGYGVVEDNGGYLIAGYTKDTKSYNSDAYLLKIDYRGNILWHRKYGLDKDDEARAIIKTDDGYVMAGYTTSLESYSKDMSIIKVDKEGKIR